MRRIGLAAICLLLATGCGDEGGPGNRAPTIYSTAPTEATPYFEYSYALGCSDPDGDMLALLRGANDTCGGTLVDHGNRQGTYAFTPEHGQADSACVVEVVCTDPELLSDTQQIPVTILPLPDVETLTFGPFEPWAEPIADYIQDVAQALQTWDFYWGIHDLAVHDHRLYIGYGDATHNAGSRVPIEIRAWSRPDPEAIQTEFVTDEEQIDRYRQPNGRLLIPGVDATQDGLMGQVYVLGSTGWIKDRTVQLAWHVHDVAVQGDDLVACGSGGTIDDYNGGTVNAFLYRHTPDATGFAIDVQLPHPQPPGDNRLTSLLVVDDTLYATGYWSDYSVSYATAYVQDGTALVAWDDLSNFYVLDSLSVTPSLGLLFGVTIDTALTFGGRVVTAGGVAVADGLEGLSVLNADPLPGGRALILARDGDEYPTPATDTWTVSVGVTSDGHNFQELAAQTFDVQPRSIAFWRRSLYLGLDDGTVWRAVGVP
ncbi:MAG: hypothetical protein ABI333_28990 [bacterium]